MYFDKINEILRQEGTSVEAQKKVMEIHCKAMQEYLNTVGNQILSIVSSMPEDDIVFVLAAATIATKNIGDMSLNQAGKNLLDKLLDAYMSRVSPVGISIDIPGMLEQQSEEESS